MKRRWFQIHLSTAVALMICAGGLLWLNFRATCEPFRVQDQIVYQFWDRGWPFRMTWGRSGREPHWVGGSGSNQPFELFTAPPPPPVGLEGSWVPELLAANIGVAFLILLFIGIAFERLLRRREGNSK